MKKHKNSLHKMIDNIIMNVRSVVSDRLEINLLGRESLYINSHCGLACADENIIALRAKNLSVRVIGSNLQISAISDSRAYISGKIDQICFD